MLFKVLMIGDSGVGKTCLMMRFCEDSFADQHISTIGVDFKIRKLTVESGEKCKLQIWDTAGQERFRTITSSYYRGAHGVIITYDVTNKSSFDGIQKWFSEVERYSNQNVKVLLLGNKIDCETERQVTLEEVQQWAKDKSVAVREVSAKTSQNVEDSFLFLVKEILTTVNAT
uniref:Uncharacterized protein n=1 Tax=Arcella intermedia TaxID=1963864 RepID=A0A6B2LL89_9EUKA